MQEMKTRESKLPEKIVHLNRYYHFTQLMRDPEIESRLLRYRSRFDQSLQSVLILQPREGKIERLFFFFHGMDGDQGDGVVVRQIVKDYRARVVCPGGRGPSWVSDAFFADAGQVIRTHLESFREYCLLGISMGATQALVLPAFLAKELRRLLRGVIAFLPGTDLLRMQRESAHSRVRETLLRSVDGSEDRLKARSPDQLISQYPPKLSFVIFYPDEDRLMLTPPLEAFLEKLREGNFSVASFRFQGEHVFTPTYFDYKKVIDCLGQNRSENDFSIS